MTLTLLQMGFAVSDVTIANRALLPHAFTLTPRISCEIRDAVCFLWHCSLGSLPLAVSQHPALWSPDFPLSERVSQRPPGCLLLAARRLTQIGHDRITRYFTAT